MLEKGTIIEDCTVLTDTIYYLQNKYPDDSYEETIEFFRVKNSLGIKNLIMHTIDAHRLLKADKGKFFVADHFFNLMVVVPYVSEENEFKREEVKFTITQISIGEDSLVRNEDMDETYLFRGK